MSKNVNPEKSRLWVDGDAYRAPVGTVLPAAGLFTADTFSGWDPFGAIKAGFEITKNQENNNLTAWNAKGAYRKKRGEKIQNVALRPVDQSKATVLTLLQGGSVAETVPADPGAVPPVVGSGVFELIPGDDEEFALLLICRDPGFGAQAYLIERGTLDNLPNEVINDDDLAGYDLVVTALEPEGGGLAVRTFSDSNPLAAG